MEGTPDRPTAPNFVSPVTARATLLRLLAHDSFKRGDFVLSSGAHSPYYVDARLTTMSPDGLRAVGELGLRTILAQGWTPDSVGGLTLGADPISCAISYYSADSAHPVRAFTVRKEAKGHGQGRLIEGPFRSSDSCVIIEDVVTTGASALRAIDAVRAAGARVLGVLAVVDREEGGRELIERTGVRPVCLTRVSELANLGA